MPPKKNKKSVKGGSSAAAEDMAIEREEAAAYKAKRAAKAREVRAAKKAASAAASREKVVKVANEQAKVASSSLDSAMVAVNKIARVTRGAPLRQADVAVAGSVSTVLQNVARRAYRTVNGIRNLRLLQDGEGPHLPGTNYAGPGTNLEDAERYGPVDGPLNSLDRIARIHDFAY